MRSQSCEIVMGWCTTQNAAALCMRETCNIELVCLKKEEEKAVLLQCFCIPPGFMKINGTLLTISTLNDLHGIFGFINNPLKPMRLSAS